MTTSDLGACEWFVWDLQRSTLFEPTQLDEIVSAYLKKTPHADPAALACHLIEQGLLTEFQAQRILQGKPQGLVLGPYSLMNSLGSGSMGTVYQARSKNDGKLYAIKILPRRSMWNVRIARRQVRTFEQFEHPAVVPFLDAGTAGGTHYLAWPLIEGQTLESIVEYGGKLLPRVAALCALQIAEGLSICHEQGIVHGLLKPSNIMIGPNGQVRILDFGIGILLANPDAESLMDTMSTANTLTSGLDCASPESILEPSNRTPACDQYSLGCVLYYCLAGLYPFADCSAVEKMMAQQAKQPPPIRDFAPDVPQEIVDVVERLMQKAPENRYPDMSHVVDLLQPWAVKTMPAFKGPKPPPETVATPEASPRSLKKISEEPIGPAPVSGEQDQESTHNGAPQLDKEQHAEPAETEDRLGPAGLFVSAAMAASVTWLLTFWMFR